MKRIALLLLASVFCLPVRADTQTQAVQEALKSEGFYYGETDGTPGPETAAALKRYQIRNGLEVTGSVNAETSKALGLGGQGPASGTEIAPPSPPARSTPPAPPSVPSSPPTGNQGPAREVETGPVYAGPELYAVFRWTIYEPAPVGVQISVLRNAQRIMQRAGFYNGPLDGVPGPATLQALMEYQGRNRLPETRRLDMDTLARMDLLPRTANVRPMPPRFIPPPPPPPYYPYRRVPSPYW